MADHLAAIGQHVSGALTRQRPATRRLTVGSARSAGETRAPRAISLRRRAGPCRRRSRCSQPAPRWSSHPPRWPSTRACSSTTAGACPRLVRSMLNNQVEPRSIRTRPPRNRSCCISPSGTTSRPNRVRDPQARPRDADPVPAERPPRPTRTSPACSPRATWSTTATGWPSRRPGPAARPRSTPSAAGRRADRAWMSRWPRHEAGATVISSARRRRTGSPRDPAPPRGPRGDPAGQAGRPRRPPP